MNAAEEMMILSQIINTSFLQEGAEAASRTASLFYAFESWSPMRQIQTVSFRRHDTLSLR